MKSRIIHFAPGRVSPGMTLASEVSDREGHVLLASGTVLDEAMLERLIRRGVESIAVQVEDTRDEHTIALELEAAQTRLSFIFRGAGSPARETLGATVSNYRLESVK